MRGDEEKNDTYFAISDLKSNAFEHGYYNIVVACFAIVHELSKESWGRFFEGHQLLLSY